MKTDIRTIACVGAGTIGSSWATLFAQKGLRVTLYDISKERVEAGMAAMQANFIPMVASKVLSEPEAQAAARRVTPTTSLADAVADADYVQESGPERYEVKKEIFAELDRLAPAEAILATSSSYLLIGEIQQATLRPGRCVNAHPWNPPHIMPLVEIVAGAQTDPEAVERTRALMLSLGKTPVVAHKEVYGFIANRLQTALANEAIWLVGNGVASAAEVDVALKSGPGLRWALMGYFQTAMLASPGGLRETFLGAKFVDPKTAEAFAESGLSSRSPVEELFWRIHCVQDVESAFAGQDREKLQAWRDRMLLEMLRVLGDGA